MRLLPIAATGVTLALAGAAAGVAASGVSRQSAFAARAASLQHTWDVDVAEGLPASTVAPLRQELDASSYQGAWWSPVWWTSTGSALLDGLSARTTSAWHEAVAGARVAAQAPISAWAQLAAQLHQFIPTAAAAQAATWPQQIASATTPRALTALAAEWTTEVAAVRQQALAAQLAQANNEVAGQGGVAGLLRQAQADLKTVRVENLDPGQLPTLIATLQADLRASQNAQSTVLALLAADKAERSLIALNDTVASTLRPLLLLVDQAAAEQVPQADSFLSQDASMGSALRDATTAAELNAVRQRVTALQASVSATLVADKCGHNVGSGKVITVNLTLQEAVFYQDGCAVQGAPVTTGRALLRTPTGTFHVFLKRSPFQFISPWPKGSPFYYYPSWTSWVMEFASGGYFIHDAPWEPNWQFGPGSENSSGASHGCIHIPTSVMHWLYGWTPLGTTVIVSA